MQTNFINRDKIMKKDEFKKLPSKDQRTLMAHWRIAYTAKDIQQGMGISSPCFYDTLKRLDLPTNLKKHYQNRPSILDKTIEKTETPKQTKPTQKVENSVQDIKYNIQVEGVMDFKSLYVLLEMSKEQNFDVVVKSVTMG